MHCPGTVWDFLAEEHQASEEHHEERDVPICSSHQGDFSSSREGARARIIEKIQLGNKRHEVLFHFEVDSFGQRMQLEDLLF